MPVTAAEAIAQRPISRDPNEIENEERRNETKRRGNAGIALENQRLRAELQEDERNTEQHQYQ